MSATFHSTFLEKHKSECSLGIIYEHVKEECSMTFPAKRMKPLWLKTGKILPLPGLSDSSSAFYSQPIGVSRASHFKWPYLSKGALLLAMVSLLLAGCGGIPPSSSQPKHVAVTIPGVDYFSPAI